MRTKNFPQRVTVAIWLAAAAWWLVALPAAQAQTEVPFKLHFKYDLSESKSKVSKRLNTILLRPNTPQSVYLFAENTNPDPVDNVVVKLAKIESDGGASIVSQAKMGKVKGGAWEQIRFAPGDEKAEEKKDKKAEMELPGPPFEFQVWFEDATDKLATRKEMLSVRIRAPHEYVDVLENKYDPEAKTLSIEVEGGADIRGPLCFVNLDLDPLWMPGLIPVKSKGTYKQILIPGKDREAKLSAEGLQFVGGTPPAYGRVYLTIDGYERAYLFNNSFTLGTLQQLEITKPRVRILAPRYAAPAAKIPVTVQVDSPELDYTPRQKASDPRPKPLLLKIGLDLEGTGEVFLPIRELPGHREQHVFFNPAGAAGSILLKNTVSDWAIELDTTDLFGTKSLSAQILKFDASSEKYQTLEIINEQGLDAQGNKTPEFIELFAENPVNSSSFAPVVHNAAKNSMVASIILDATKPEISLGFELEKKLTHERGTPVVVKAIVLDPEPVTPITEVVFFVGEPDDKGGIPKDAPKMLGIQVDEKKPTLWQAVLPIATDKAGTFFVSVLAANQAGLTEVKTIKLVLVDPPGGNGNGGGNGLAKVVGSVAVGNLPQADVPVVLTDPKEGAIKGFTKSDKKGNYVFEGVEPGAYQIVASNAALKLRGETLVSVPKGKTLVKVKKIQMVR